MTARDFAYWAQGFFELSDATTLNEKQTTLFKKHLNLVFLHEIDPGMGSVHHQGKLSEIHHGTEIDLSDPMVPHSMYPNFGMTDSTFHQNSIVNKPPGVRC